MQIDSYKMCGDMYECGLAKAANTDLIGLESHMGGFVVMWGNLS